MIDREDLLGDQH